MTNLELMKMIIRRLTIDEIREHEDCNTKRYKLLDILNECVNIELRYNDGSHYTKDEHGRFTGSTGSGGGSGGGNSSLPKNEQAVADVKNSEIAEIASNAHDRNQKLEKLIKRCINEPKPIFAEGYLKRNYLRIKPEKGKYITALHGNPNSVQLFDTFVDDKVFANVLKSRKDYHGEEIVLISCNTGNTSKSKNCFAQRLANRMNVAVYAPTRYGAISSNGKYYSSDITGKVKEGKFEKFTPKKGS